jgi:hypothetical protein
VPWAGCVWGLPFLTVLAPSERHAARQGKRHKTLADWGRQVLLQVARWLPGRRVVAVADGSFSAVALLRDLAPHLTAVTRLRLDACLCAPPPPRRPRRRGRPPIQGARLPSLAERLRDRRTRWRRVVLDGWYGHRTRRLDVATDTALWSHRGARVAIRWVLVRDPSGEKEPQAFLCTDQQAEPADILRWFVRRWRTEVVFPQMTKADALTLPARGQCVTDLDIGVRDDHPVDEEQHEFAPLLEARLGQAALHPFAERRQ